MDLTGRVMEPEKIFFGDNKWVTEANADWGRAASNNKMISAVSQWLSKKHAIRLIFAVF